MFFKRSYDSMVLRKFQIFRLKSFNFENFN